MSGANYERELRNILREQGWIVFRSAGSFICDLIALKPNTHMLVEVKSLKGDVYRTSKDKEQFDLLNGYAKQGFNVYYYIRWKGRKNKWDSFKLPLESYPIFRNIEKKRKNINKYYTNF